MKRIFAFSIRFLAGTFLVGHTPPRSVSDLAQYSRLSRENRVSRILESADDLFRRRRYEDAITVYETVLILEEGDLSATMGISKSRTELSRERYQHEKQLRYQKYGYLVPKKEIILDSRWGPDVGHVKVIYSKPKPYVRPIRKVHAKATDDEIANAVDLVEKSGLASDYFELSMKYWSRGKLEESLSAYFKAVSLDIETLAEDDELMLLKASEVFDKEILLGKASANTYLNSGKLSMMQGELRKAIDCLVKAAAIDEKMRSEASDIVKILIDSPQVADLSSPPDIYSFKQAYVYEKDGHYAYFKIILNPKNEERIIPIDLLLPEGSVTEAFIDSKKDTPMVFYLPGIGDALRLWLVLGEKNRDSLYEVRVKLKLAPSIIKFIDLSNYSVSAEVYSNWSFVITSEFNYSEINTPKGEFEERFDNVYIGGYNLTASDGRGPTLSLEAFKEPLPHNAKVWELIDRDEQTLSSLL